MMKTRGSILTGTEILCFVAGIFALTAITLSSIVWDFKHGVRFVMGGSAVLGALTLIYLFRKRDPELAARRKHAAVLAALAALALAPLLSSLAGSVGLAVAPWVSMNFQWGPVSPIIQVLLVTVSIVCVTKSTSLLKPYTMRPDEVDFRKVWVEQVIGSEPTRHLREDLKKESAPVYQQIASVATINPHVLARRYIGPKCQQINPSDFHDANPLVRDTRPVHEFIGRFLRQEFVEKDGTHVLFILSDAGMGKSSLLLMLRMTGIVERIWPEDTRLELLKMGSDTLSKVAEMKSRRKTVLLLDALDEDPKAHGRVDDRLREVLKHTQDFRQVLISCRTYFFPSNSRNPMMSGGYVHVSGYSCTLTYLTPFDDNDVEEYLRRAFARSTWLRIISKRARESHAKLAKARIVSQQMRSLRFRPMLLAHIDRLLNVELDYWTEWSVYDVLVNRWLLREHREKGGPDPREARIACEALALEMQVGGVRDLPNRDFHALTKERPELELLSQIDRGGVSLLNQKADLMWRFSHYSVQEFLMACAILRLDNNSLVSEIRATEETFVFLREFSDLRMIRTDTADGAERAL